MRKDLTDITLILDRSGSMASCQKEAENGVNHFVEEQKKQPGEAKFTLVQFDTNYEFVHNAVPIKDVPKFTLVPRGMTALLDAVGRAIAETGVRLANTPEDQRPGLVVVVIVTDGAENASHEYTKARVEEMITHQTEKYNWQFTFLGANQDAFAEAGSLGISQSATANYAVHNAGAAFAAASNNTVRMRYCSASGDQVQNQYTSSEVDAMSN